MEWYEIAAGLVFAAVLALLFWSSWSNAKEWLLWAVTTMETELGNGTGQLKLRGAYDMFVVRFPVFSKIVPFWLFSKWVDEALSLMKEWLHKYPAIDDVVEGGLK